MIQYSAISRCGQQDTSKNRYTLTRFHLGSALVLVWHNELTALVHTVWGLVYKICPCAPSKKSTVGQAQLKVRKAKTMFGAGFLERAREERARQKQSRSIIYQCCIRPLETLNRSMRCLTCAFMGHGSGPMGVATHGQSVWQAGWTMDILYLKNKRRRAMVWGSWDDLCFAKLLLRPLQTVLCS